ncbi:MAG TPA: hypothetical protein VF972_02855, partial [Actinomycetota bacterium]
MKYPIRTLSRTGLLAAALLVAVGCGQRLPGDQPAGGAVPTSPGISVPPTVHGSGSPLPSCLGTG